MSSEKRLCAYAKWFQQHLLLGGLEDTYPKLYKKTAIAIRKWMLYRPMLPDDRDVLFSGKVTTRGHPTEDLKLTAEVTHLTCFIGGMMGMSAKVYGIDADLEIAKKLTDGCVWAYEATTSGIMPERATTIACESTISCPWNQTAYYLAIDPSGEQRDYVLAEYDKAKAQRDSEEKTAKVAAPSEATNAADISGDAATRSDEQGGSSPPASSPVQKRQLRADGSNTGSTLPDQESSKPIAGKSESNLFEEMSRTTETELEQIPAGFGNEAPPTKTVPSIQDAQTQPEDPNRPLSHKEYVDARIKMATLPAGFVNINSAKYILR